MQVNARQNLQLVVNVGKEYTEQSEQNARYQRMLERVAKKEAEKAKVDAGNALAAAGDDQ